MSHPVHEAPLGPTRQQLTCGLSLAGWKLVEQEFLELPADAAASSQTAAITELMEMAKVAQESRHLSELEERKREVHALRQRLETAP